MKSTASPTPTAELADRLRKADEALARNDLDVADAQMRAAAELCRRLQQAGLGVPEADLGTLRALAERCGAALDRIGRSLEADSLRDENHRRGIATYLAALTR